MRFLATPARRKHGDSPVALRVPRSGLRLAQDCRFPQIAESKSVLHGGAHPMGTQRRIVIKLGAAVARRLGSLPCEAVCALMMHDEKFSL